MDTTEQPTIEKSKNRRCLKNDPFLRRQGVREGSCGQQILPKVMFLELAKLEVLKKILRQFWRLYPPPS